MEKNIGRRRTNLGIFKKQLKWSFCRLWIIFAWRSKAVANSAVKARFEPKVVTLDLGLPPETIANAERERYVKPLEEILSCAKTQVMS